MQKYLFPPNTERHVMTEKIEKEVAQKPEFVIANEKARVLELQDLENVHGGIEGAPEEVYASRYSFICL
jgi:hypothetical protein